MAREPETLRLEIEELERFFNGKRALTQADVARYTGRKPAWVREHLNVGAEGISLATLAYRLACM